jgi:AcrR family transcriptional regulator
MKQKETSRDRAQAQTREALLSAAEILVAERGFSGASVAEITAKAGYTKGAFYSNFDSREAMMLELLHRLKVEQRLAMKTFEVVASSSLTEALDALADSAGRHATDPYASLLVAEVQLQAQRDSAFLAELEASFEVQIAAIAHMLRVFAQSANISLEIEPEKMARLVMAMTQGLSQQPADKQEVTQIVRSVYRQFFGV